MSLPPAMHTRGLSDLKASKREHKPPVGVAHAKNAVGYLVVPFALLLAVFSIGWTLRNRTDYSSDAMKPGGTLFRQALSVFGCGLRNVSSWIALSSELE